MDQWILEVMCNLKHRYATYLKFGAKFTLVLQRIITRLVLKRMSVSALQLKKIYFILSQICGICCRCNNLTYFYNKVCRETPLVIETSNLKTESLAFQNRYLNGAHFIADIKLP